MPSISLPLGTCICNFGLGQLLIWENSFPLLKFIFYLAFQRNPYFYVFKNSTKIREWSLGNMQPVYAKIFDTLLRKCMTFPLCKFLPKTQKFSKTSQMIFVMGGEYLVASSRCVYTSGKNPGQTKNVLPAQN